MSDGFATQPTLQSKSAGGLVALPNHFYDFSTDYTDSAGSWDLIAHGSPIFVNDAGPGGQAVMSTDNSSWAKASTNRPASGFHDSRAISIWVKFDSLNDGSGANGGGDWFFSWRDSPIVVSQLFFRHDSTRESIMSTGPEKTSILPNFIPEIAQWYHIVDTFDGTTLRLYVDGVEIGNLESSSNVPEGGSYPFTIGGPSFVSGANIDFEGDVCMAGIFDRGLTPEEVTYLNNGGSGRQFDQLSLAA